MKESNEAWPTRKLSEVANLDRNSIAPEKILSGTKYIGLEDINSEGKIAKPHDVANGDLASTKFSFETKHILYGKLRPYLSKIALPDFRGICSTDIIPIMPKPIINRVFLFYYLRQPELIKLATERCTGANLPRLSPNELADFDVLVPPLPIQKRIAEILEKADAAREKRRQTLALTEQFLQSAFLDMFGDPVTNPKGWSTAFAGECVEVNSGYPFKSKGYIDDPTQIKLCSGLIIMPNMIDWNNGKYWPKDKCTGLDNYFLRDRDIVMALDRPWISSGFKIGIIKKADLPALLVQRTARLRSKNIDQYVLYYLFNNPFFEKHCKTTETTVPHISTKDINNYKIILPPLSLQHQFAALVEKVETMRARQRESERELEQLFQSLMQRAFRQAQGGLFRGELVW